MPDDEIEKLAREMFTKMDAHVGRMRGALQDCMDGKGKTGPSPPSAATEEYFRSRDALELAVDESTSNNPRIVALRDWLKHYRAFLQNCSHAVGDGVGARRVAEHVERWQESERAAKQAVAAK